MTEASLEERFRSEERDLDGRERPDLEKGDIAEQGDFGRGEELPDGREEDLPYFEEGDFGRGEELPNFEGSESAQTEEMSSFYERMIRDGAPGLCSFPLRDRAVSITESYSGSETDSVKSTRYAKHHEPSTTETIFKNIRTVEWLQATATMLTLQARIFEHTPLQNRLLMLAITLHDAKARLAPSLSWNAFYRGCKSLGFCISTGELSGAALSDRLRACPERRVSLWHLRRPELLIVRRTCLCRIKDLQESALHTRVCIFPEQKNTYRPAYAP